MDAALFFDIDSSRARTAATDLAKLQGAATKLAADWSKTDAALRRSNGQFASSAEVVERYGNEIYGLAAKYNPALKATYDLQKAEGELNRAIALGVLTKEQAAATLTQLQVRLRETANAAAEAQLGITRAAGAAGGVARANGTAGKSFDELGHQVQNASFQVGDFFVQIASGQSATVALAQQLPQLLGGFGVFGAVAGAAVAIGGALIPMWLGSADAAETLSDRVDSLDDSLRALAEAQANATLPVDQLITKYGALGDEMARVFENQLAIARQEIDAFSSALVSAIESTTGLDGFVARFDALKIAVDAGVITQNEYINQLRDLEAQFGLTVRQALQYENLMQTVASAEGPEQQAQAWLKVHDWLLANNDELRAQGVAVDDLIKQSNRVAESHGNSAAAAGAATDKTLSWANAAALLAANMNGAADAARTAAAAIGAAISAQNEQAGFTMGLDPFSASSGRALTANAGGPNVLEQEDFTRAWEERVRAQEEAIRKSEQLARRAARASSGGGGGGGGGGRSAADAEVKTAEEKYEKLRISMERDSVFQIEKYARDQETLKAALDQKLITEQEYQARLNELRVGNFGFDWEQQQLQYQMDQEALQTALDQKLITYETFYARMKEMQWQRLLNEENQSALAQDLQNTSDYFSQLYSLSGSSFDGLLRLQKTFAASAALIDAYRAAVGAMADTQGPFWLRLAAYGKVLAAGLGVVAAIKGGGSGGGKGGGAGASSAGATRQEPERQVLVRLEGSPWAVDMAEDILQQIYDQSKDGRVIISRDRS